MGVCEVTETATTADVIRIGSRVRVRYDDTHDEDEFVLVSEEVEALPGRLSPGSPLGRALLGRRRGEQVMFRAPGGAMVVHVVAVA